MAYYRQEASTKQGQTKLSINHSTACLNAVCAAINVVSGSINLTSEETMRNFEDAYNEMWRTYRGHDGESGLLGQIRAYWARKNQKEGGTAAEVVLHANAIEQTIRAIVLLASAATQHQEKYETGMRMFHFTYKSLAAQGVAEGIKDKADADYPDFWEKYREWLNHNHKAEPVV